MQSNPSWKDQTQLTQRNLLMLVPSCLAGGFDKLGYIPIATAVEQCERLADRGSGGLPEGDSRTSWENNKRGGEAVETIGRRRRGSSNSILWGQRVKCWKICSLCIWRKRKRGEYELRGKEEEENIRREFELRGELERKTIKLELRKRAGDEAVTMRAEFKERGRTLEGTIREKF
jgi:hypothetical protein